MNNLTSNEMKEKVIKAALVKMFKDDDYFNICAIDKCIQVARVNPDKELYDMLSTLHCMHWSQMDKETYNWCIQATAELFNVEPVDLSEIENMRIGFFKSVFNRIGVLQIKCDSEESNG